MLLSASVAAASDANRPSSVDIEALCLLFEWCIDCPSASARVFQNPWCLFDAVVSPAGSNHNRPDARRGMAGLVIGACLLSAGEGGGEDGNSLDRAQLVSLIVNKIGMHRYTECLSKLESCMDRAFGQRARSAIARIQKLVIETYAAGTGEASDVIEQYKQIIRAQDRELSELRTRIHAQGLASARPAEEPQTDENQRVEENKEISRLKKALEERAQTESRLTAETEKLRQRCEELESAQSEVPSPKSTPTNADADHENLRRCYEELQKEHTDLLVLLANQEIDKLKMLEIVESLGGRQAVQQAQLESAALLADAFRIV